MSDHLVHGARAFEPGAATAWAESADAPPAAEPFGSRDERSARSDGEAVYAAQAAVNEAARRAAARQAPGVGTRASALAAPGAGLRALPRRT